MDAVASLVAEMMGLPRRNRGEFNKTINIRFCFELFYSNKILGEPSFWLVSIGIQHDGIVLDTTPPPRPWIAFYYLDQDSFL